MNRTSLLTHPDGHTTHGAREPGQTGLFTAIRTHFPTGMGTQGMGLTRARAH